MTVPSDQQLDAGEAKVSDGIRSGMPPREIARETFLVMRDVSNPVGRPRVYDYEDLVDRLLNGESRAEVFRGVGGAVRQRVLAMFKERVG